MKFGIGCTWIPWTQQPSNFWKILIVLVPMYFDVKLRNLILIVSYLSHFQIPISIGLTWPMISAMNTMLWIIWGLLMATSSVCWPEILLAGVFLLSRQALSWHLQVELARLSSTTHFKDCRWAQLGQNGKNPPKIDFNFFLWNWRIILMPATVWQIFHTKRVHLFGAHAMQWPEMEVMSICWNLLGQNSWNHFFQVNFF